MDEQITACTAAQMGYKSGLQHYHTLNCTGLWFWFLRFYTNHFMLILYNLYFSYYTFLL